MITKTVTLRTGGGTGMWTAHALDTFFGPHLSELTACTAPDVPELPPYLISFALNRAAFSTVDDQHRATTILIAGFIRHTAAAIIEYREATAAVREYVSRLRDETLLRFHDIAVSRFQNCLVQASAGQSCLDALHYIHPKIPPMYGVDDGSAHDRLDKLANRVRHFHDNTVKAAKKRNPGPFSIAPIWITNDGLAARRNTKVQTLSFVELSDLLLGATADAQALSEARLTKP